MPTKDLHEKPFTEETITKLEIFENYAKAWIPTFIMNKWCFEMNIFDFFAGTGYDKNGVPGSPIRILTQIAEQVGNIFKTKQRITVYLNELDESKFELLKKSCSKFIEDNLELRRCFDKKLLKIIYTNKGCEEVFDNYYEKMQKNPSLVYLDQNGVKFLADKYFLRLIQCKQVDFLYFISSSYFIRFGKQEEFKNILYIDWENAHRNPYRYIHQYILEKLREKISTSNKTHLYPFTIKKGPNIYGIIFGATHIRAVDKFLNITWKENEINGNANFDIDDDTLKNLQQEDLFGNKEYTKIQKFQNDIRAKVLDGILHTNKDVYIYSLEEGHIPKHAEEVLKEMKHQNMISYEGRTPLVNYNQVIKNQRIISYEIVKK